jgi:hypothetical protein
MQAPTDVRARLVEVPLRIQEARRYEDADRLVSGPRMDRWKGTAERERMVSPAVAYRVRRRGGEGAGASEAAWCWLEERLAGIATKGDEARRPTTRHARTRSRTGRRHAGNKSGPEAKGGGRTTYARRTHVARLDLFPFKACRTGGALVYASSTPGPVLTRL